MGADVSDRTDRTIADPNSGETITFLETSEESGGQRVVMQLALAPGASVPLHAHPIDETFSMIEGVIEFETDGRAVDLANQAVITVPGGHLHGFHNSSPRPAVMRIVGTPGTEAEYGLRIKFLLSRDGYLPVPGGGRPKDPLLGAVVISRGGLYFPPLPRWLFRPLFAALGAIGRWTGRERFLMRSYPEYGIYLKSIGVGREPGRRQPT